MEIQNTLLRSDYTYDQFIALSKREPYLSPFDSEFYYRLEMTEFDGKNQSYPAFKLGPTHITDFPSFDSAEYYMEKFAKEMRLYRSRITQYPLYENMDERGAQWLYDHNCNFIDKTIVQKIGNAEETHFFGRPLDMQRFRPGDIAEIVIDDKVKLVPIIGRMPIPDECWKIYESKRSEYALDYSSDSYAILPDDEGHVSYAIATALMKPRFPVTPEMRAKLLLRHAAMVESAINGTNPTVRMIPIIDDNDENDETI